MNTVTISIERFKELEAFEQNYKKLMRDGISIRIDAYYFDRAVIDFLTKDEALEKINKNLSDYLVSINNLRHQNEALQNRGLFEILFK